MAMPTANNWKRAILDVPSDAGDRGVTTLHDLLSDPDERANINELRGEDETVFLAAHPEGTVAFLHHLRVVGGTRLRPEVSVLALVGVGPQAYPVKLVPAAAFAAVEVATPTWTNLRDLDTRAAVVGAVLGAALERVPALLALPPSVASAFLDEDQLEPWRLIQPLRAAVTAYDAAKPADAAAFDDAAHVRHIPKWLWAAQKASDAELKQIKAYIGKCNSSGSS